MQKRSASKKLSIIIVTYNSSAVIANCLASIKEDVKTYVIDNASTDDTCKIVKQAMPNAILIKNDVNLGFGIANNIALEKADTEFCLLLNPDTILNEDTIQKLLEAADNYPQTAIISPALYLENGDIQQSYKMSVFKREQQKSKFIEPSGDLCADCFSGAVMLLRMKCFKEIGFFDPKIFLFYEDDDLCIKAKNAGYGLVLTPDAKVTHLMGASSPSTTKMIFFKNRHLLWSRLYLQEKYKSKQDARMLALLELYVNLAKFLLNLATYNFKKSAKSCGKMAGCLRYFIGLKP